MILYNSHVTQCIVRLFLAVSVPIAWGCGAVDSGSSTTGSATATTGSATSARPTDQTVLVSDPVENGFTVQMPKGWRNLAYTARSFDLTRFVLNSVSPDGSTVLFIGDPTVPLYVEPSFSAINVTRMQVKVQPLMSISEFQPAQVYFPAYVTRKFGALEGFEMLPPEDDPEALAVNEAKMKAEGTSAPLTATLIRFKYIDAGKPLYAMVSGMTVRHRDMWSVGIAGISTPGDPGQYRETIFNWIRTFKVNPEWTAKQAAMHEQRMEEIRQRGRDGRQRLQDMANSHQARMNAIQAAGDASMKSYYERSAASDVSQRNFLNYINEETTVASADGKVHQVATGYQRYFMHKRTGAYVGGDAHTNLDSLRKMGLNPDDYTEVTIKK